MSSINFAVIRWWGWLGWLLVVLPALTQAAPKGTLELDAAQRAFVQQHPALRYAPEKDYGPFVYLDEKGAVQGLSVDFLNLIAQKTGLQVQAMPARSLSENLELAKRRETDIITSLRPNPERAAYLGFTSPYVSIPAILVVGASQSRQIGLADMAGKRVGVGKGYAVEAHVRQHYPKVQWVALASDNEALQQLLAGQLDGLVADVASIHFIARQSGKPPIVMAARVGFDYPLSFAWRNDWPELGRVLQSGLQAISLAEREKLITRWMPDETDGGGRNEGVYLAIIGVLLLGAAAGALTLYRKRGRAQ